MTENLGEKQVGVMDRGFAALAEMLKEDTKLYILM
jgi:hypothetical protein